MLQPLVLLFLVPLACANPAQSPPVGDAAPSASPVAPGPTAPDPDPMEALGTHSGWTFGRVCDASLCRPRLRSPADNHAPLALPYDPEAPPWAIEGVELVELSTVERPPAALRVDWRAIGTPRAAVGSWVQEYTTVVDAASGTLILHVETGHQGGASEEHCAGTLTLAPEAALLTQRCQLKACIVGGATAEECADGPQTRSRTLPWVSRP